MRLIQWFTNSATVTKINDDSADIDHFSTENINFDSATGDSATITNIAAGTIDNALMQIPKYLEDLTGSTYCKFGFNSTITKQV